MNRISTGHSQRSYHSSEYHRGRPPSRPPSEQLCELHVYKVPHQLWRESFNNILNNVVTETISLGIIRIPAELRLSELREEIVQQLQLEELQPRDFTFLRSVGRSLTTLRTKQEYQLKAKHFLPPMAPSPEIYIIEIPPDMRDALAISDRSSQSPLSRRTSPTHRGYNSTTYRNGYTGNPENERSNYLSRQPHSPVNKYQPLPQIEYGSNRSPSPIPEPQSYYYPNSSSSNTQQHNHTSHNHSQPFTQQDTAPKHHNPSPQKAEPEHKPSKSPVVVKEAVQANHAYNDPKWNQTQTSAKQTPPPRSADKGRDRRLDDDSGVAGLTPDDERNRRNRDDYNSRGPRRFDSERFTYDEETEAERRRRLEDLESRNDLDRDRWDSDRDERQRLAQEDRRREEEDRRRKEERERREKEDEERRRKEEEERRRKEEEERRRREEEKRQLDEDERRRLQEEKERQEEEERQKNQYKNDITRFPSPPPLQMSSPEPEPERDTLSARQQRRNEREQLMRELEEVRAARHAQEKEREDLVKRAKSLQHKTTNRRNEARDLWKKRYFEEKKKTAPLEENSNRLRQELEALHRRLMNTLEGPKEKNVKGFDGKPSVKTNYVIQCTRLQHDIEDLQRRVENAKMKLTAEMKLRSQAQTELKASKSEVMQNRLTLKMVQSGQTPRSFGAATAMSTNLRNQAEGELRALRAELTQKKTNINRSRQQQLAAMKPQTKEINRDDREINISHNSDQSSSYHPSNSSRILQAF